jgi:transcriptional regulator with XRE-family HTH domain
MSASSPNGRSGTDRRPARCLRSGGDGSRNGTTEERVYVKKKKVPKSSTFKRPSTREKLIELRTNPDNWNRTQKEIAELLGVTDRYVRELESDDAFWEEVFARNKRNAKGKDAAIWRAMTKEAIDGSFFQQKLYFEMTGQYIQKQVHQGDKNNPVRVEGELTIKQLIDRMSEDEIRDRLEDMESAEKRAKERPGKKGN